MNVPLWVWLATVGGLIVVITLDLLIVDARPHEITLREATRWVIFYVAAAVLFGVGVGLLAGGRYAGEFFAGYLTEYSLSVDNLFVFVVLLGAFSVPAVHRHKVLLVGVLLALVMRGAFIAAGSAVINRFTASFYVFGLFLLLTGIQLVRKRDEEPEVKRNPVMRLAERVLPVTEHYDGGRVLTRVNGRRMLTPLFMVMIAVGTTDLLFALDSIPAIFGLTKEPYLVFTANAFALLGLRQLFFMLDGLLSRLVYLTYGLAVILCFIGVKLILAAAHSTWHGVPHIGIAPSLAVIVVTLAVTTVASLRASRGGDAGADGAPVVPPSAFRPLGDEPVREGALREGPAGERDALPTSLPTTGPRHRGR